MTALQDFMICLLSNNQQEVVVVNDEAKLGPSSNRCCFSSVTQSRSSSCNTHEEKAARKWSPQKVNPLCTSVERNHSAPSLPTRGLHVERNHSAPSLPTRGLLTRSNKKLDASNHSAPPRSSSLPTPGLRMARFKNKLTRPRGRRCDAKPYNKVSKQGVATPEEALSQNPAVASPQVLPASKSVTKITTASVENEDQRGRSIIQLIKMLSLRAATAMTSNPISYEDTAEEEDTLTAATVITSNPIPYEDPPAEEEDTLTAATVITSNPIPYEDPPAEEEETLTFWKREI